jgi:hypothetical protein
MRRFEALRDSGAAKLLGTNYPEQGRYAEAQAATGAEPGLVDPATPAVRYVDRSSDLPQAARASTTPADPGAGVLLVDFDGDGALDLLDVRAPGVRLLRNLGTRFEDVTSALGLATVLGGWGALAGDCDADGRLELVVLRDGGMTLLKRNGEVFVDATVPAGLTWPADARVTTAALADVDHDGDVDLFVAGVSRATPAAGAPPKLFRNDGACVFREGAQAAGLTEAPLLAVAVAPTDFDNGRDVDLLLLGEGAPPRLFSNRRDQTFRDAAAEVGLTRAARYASLALGDLDKDGFVDLFLGVTGGRDLLARRDAQGAFALAEAPLESSGSGAALALDYDADGLLDLVTLGSTGLRVLRNRGTDWTDASSSALAGLADDARGVAPIDGRRALAAGDLDADGDTDLVLRARDGGLRLLRNEDGPPRAAVSLRLDGLVSNRSGLGAKVELRAGSLWQKLETSSASPPVAPADVVFGLGRRATADAVRVLWPSGIVQTEVLADLPPDARRSLSVKELDRKPSSCPYLYVWDGRSFRFLTDFLGGGEMGYLVAPGVFNTPDPVEHVRLPPEMVRARDGRYELRVTNELEEALFLDRLALTVVTHAEDVAVFPNEGMTSPPKPERLWAVRGLRPPAAARDDGGRDVLERLRHTDRRFVDDLPLERVRGYARVHALTLALGEVGPHPLLLMTGWTDYAFSSDNRAAAQAGLALHPPALQVRDAAGEWRTALPQIGVPVGRPQTVVVDLGGLDLGPTGEVRLLTSMRVYWDQAQVGEADDGPLETFELLPLRAELRERGFSAPVSDDGREPFFDFDYARVTPLSPWKTFPGRYTRLGDVRALLLDSDDAFVVSRPGDELALTFDGPPDAPGRARTLLLKADGYSKEMDPNSASPHTLEPLPFHGMTRYPYGPEEIFPRTRPTGLMQRTRTRAVPRPLPPLVHEPGAAIAAPR